MKNHPFLKTLFLFAAFLIIYPAPVLADGYWREGYWCSQENNYCRETWGSSHNYNRDWNSPNYYHHEPRLESIEYNGIVIKTGIIPRTDICSLVKEFLNQNHCDGYQGFNESTRTHVFRNYSNQQYYQNNQWENRQYYRYRRNSIPTWHRRGGCVYQDKKIRVLCN